MYPSDHYFDTSRVSPGGRVPQAGTPAVEDSAQHILNLAKITAYVS